MPVTNRKSARLHAFVDAYLGEAQGNGRSAAIAAGYAPRGAHVRASELLARDDVRAMIAQRQQHDEERCAMDRNARLEALAAVARGEALAVIGMHEGLPVVGPPKHADRIRAIAEMNRMTGDAADAGPMATIEQLEAALEQARRIEAMQRKLRALGDEGSGSSTS